MTRGELDQKRRSVRALVVLAESRALWEAGHIAESRVQMDLACTECGLSTVQAISGAIRIGEIPSPGTPEWDEHLAAQQDALAVAEAETTSGSGEA
jgi:hypothetical protein